MHKISIILTDITKQAGTERAVVNLANIFISLGYSVSILSTDSEIGISPYNLKGEVEIIHLGLKIATAKGFSKINEYKKLKQRISLIIKSENIDCLIGTYSLFNALITKMHGVKTIGCEHFNYESAGKVHTLLRRIFYKKLNAVVCLTERDASCYSFIKKDRLFVIPNSLSFDCESLSNCTEKRIIAVGRLTKQKGFDLLLDSAAIMKERIPDWHLDIFGEGEDRDMLIAKINELQLQNFVSLQGITKNIRREYCSCSIIVVSSRWEGFSMVLVESQSCGIPAVTFDCPCGPADIVVNNETGFVVPLCDTKSFAEKTIELAKNENLRKKFGKRAHELSKRFSSESVTEKWEKLIAKLFGEEC